MQQANIHTYLKDFFQATNCPIVTETSSYLEVQLTNDMDKRLMNRPFYWHYLEKTGGTPNPMKVIFITDLDFEDKEIKGEYIHYGSRRLHQIFAAAKDLGSHIRLFEQIAPTTNQQNYPLQPWLGLNIKLTLQCDRKKDILYSIGLNLLNGKLIENFQAKLEKINVTPKIPDFCFTMSPIISVTNGIKRIEDVLFHTQSLEDHTWAEEALKRWEHDEKLLSHFYEDSEELPESYYAEKEALKEQYNPSIQLHIMNGGLFYLTQATTIKAFA
ncbi:MAG: YqhG family protein [Bacillaceae bacterium]